MKDLAEFGYMSGFNHEFYTFISLIHAHYPKKKRIVDEIVKINNPYLFCFLRINNSSFCTFFIPGELVNTLPVIVTFLIFYRAFSFCSGRPEGPSSPIRQGLYQ